MSRRAALAAIAVLALAAVSLALALTLAPAVLLLAIAASGRRPGERLIERLRRMVHPRRALRPAAVAPPRLAVLVRRTGRRLECALAMRPPPHHVRHLDHGARLAA